MPTKRTCSIDTCDRPARTRGWCVTHYDRWLKRGDANWHRPTAFDRFVAKIEFGDCWLWTSTTTKDGYGEFYVASPNGRGSARHTPAHRWSYEHFVGPIPDGLHIDHLCRVRACVNPDHLEPVTVQVNLLRSPVQPSTQNAMRLFCKRGHALPPPVAGERKRRCKVCVSLRHIAPTGTVPGA